MAILRPFRALRPLPPQASQVAAVPYDVVNRQEALDLSRGNTLSFLHVSRPEIDLPEATDPYATEVYLKARENFDRLRNTAPLIEESEPSLYIYRLQMGPRSQTGIAATFSVDEYDRGLIKKHEKTRQDKEDDRTRHVLTLEAQTGPVFLTFRGTPKIAQQIAKQTAEAPLFHFQAADGITHTLWKVTKTATLIEHFKEVPALYIADGHHRAASASRARTVLKEKNATHQGDEPYNFVLAAAFPAEELKIFPYYRVIKDLNGLTAASLFARLNELFTIQTPALPEPARGQFSFYFEGTWYGLTPRFAPPAGPSYGEQLDVSILQNQVLAPLFGILDPRTDKRIDFVGGIRGTAELERLVESGLAKIAFSLHPTTVEDLMKISDAGEIMPPKSTWFEPKLRDGLLSQVLKPPRS